MKINFIWASFSYQVFCKYKLRWSRCNFEAKVSLLPIIANYKIGCDTVYTPAPLIQKNEPEKRRLSRCRSMNEPKGSNKIHLDEKSTGNPYFYRLDGNGGGGQVPPSNLENYTKFRYENCSVFVGRYFINTFQIS